MKRLIFALSLLAGYSGIALAAETDVQTTLRVFQFNSVAEQYLDRQTAVTIIGDPGTQRLIVRFAPYGRALSSSGPAVMLDAAYADEYMAYISKYREWAAKATEAGDVFKKEIGRAKSAPGLSLSFEFFGAAAGSHFLVVAVCSLGNCSVQEPMYLNQKGAGELYSLLEGLKAGKLPGEDVSAKYK
jgi:rhodanese-related sulfurtransferase